MTIVWSIIELTATIIECTIIIYFFNKLTEPKFQGFTKKILSVSAVFLLIIVVSILNKYHIFEGWLIVILILISYIYLIFATKSITVHKFILPIIVFSTILVINVFITYILSIIFDVPDTFIFSENNGARIIALFLTKFLFYIVIKSITLILKKESLKINNKESVISLVISLITFFIAIALVLIQIETKSDNKLFFICIFGILLLDIFVIYMMNRLADDNKNKLKISLLELQLSEQKSMIIDAGAINTEIKKAEHDLKHHMLSLMGIIEDGDLASAKTYIRSLIREYETNIFKYIIIDNSAINSILNLKIGRCHSENIDIKVEVESDFDNFNDVDICVLIANLLDNAIEASNNIENPFISLSIRNEKNYLCIMIKNKISYSVIEGHKNLKTTKSDKSKHGFGLYSISQIVEKYDGIKNFYEKNGFFVADIWLKRNSISLADRIKTEANYQIRQK